MIAGVGLACAAASAAFAQTPCEPYTIRSGDTLRDIAQSAYGDGARYQLIYSANRGVIGSNVNMIEVGDRINIPCDDGTISTSNAVANTTASPTPAPAATVEVSSSSTLPFQRDIRFLTGSNYPPFTDENLPGGGMITELVRTAMARGDDNREYRIDFINDWGSHLETLLPTGVFDLGFPWYRPDCSRLDKLTGVDRTRCTDFDWSNPFYEVVIGYFVRPDSPYAEARQHSDLFGAHVCRAEGYFTFDLMVEDLVEPNVEFSAPVLPQECFQAVVDGTADVATFSVTVAEDVLPSVNGGDQLMEVSNLATIQTLHVLAHKSNPFGRTYLAVLNKGLREMGQSGEWFEIVRTYLAAN